MKGVVPPTREMTPNSPTLEGDPTETVTPRREVAFDGLGIERGLTIFDTIAEGGMGVVRRGEQRALGREVAVMGLKPMHRDARSAGKLVREARVTGGLEHPNVIPVYEIAEEEDGSPLIVLKRVEGVEWLALMHDQETVRARFGNDDLFEWNVRVLIQVCNVVSFAHSRRVLHRDLKPSNVMIGKFGEVYVLDWGIAVTMSDETSSLLPRAAEANEMAGTPVYMAPEMLGGQAAMLGERTDVYLLGAILYQIITERPPHAGDDFPAIVASIAAGRPDIPAGVNAEVATILRRALAREPEDRYESAAALRLALEDYLRHRTANELARDAEDRLRALTAMLEAPDGERDAIYRVYGECRFGLRHALEVWPENAPVRRSLEQATLKMVALELDRGEPKAARVLLSDLDSVPPELEQRVRERERAAAEEYRELRRLRADLDPASGRGIRRITFVILSTVWVLYPLLIELLRVTEHWTYSREVGVVFAAIVLGLVIGVVWWARAPMLSTAINRRLAVAVVIAPIAQLAQSIVTLVNDGPMLGPLHDQLLIAATIMAMLAASVHWGLLVSAVVFLGAYLVIGVIGLEPVLYATTFANTVLFLNLFVVLARTPRDRTASVTDGRAGRVDD
jgi:hypothetical protein